MKHWRESRIGDEVEFAYGKSLPAHAREMGTFKVYGSNGCVGSHSSPLVPGPGIVVGRKGSVGKVVYSQDDFWPIDTTYYVINKNNHKWRFLYHLLSHIGLDELNSHSAVPGLNREVAYSIPISLPDKTEQKDIASALDIVEHSGKQETWAIEQTHQLKRAAMRTLFTRGLRGEAQKETEIGPMPKNWEVASFASVREKLQYGTSVRCTYDLSDCPVLRIPNVEPQRINSDDLKYCTLTGKDAAKYRLNENDLIFIRTNGVLDRLGSCAVYAGHPANALFASYLIRARLKLDRVNPHFIAYFFGSETGTNAIAGRATPASDGKFNLNTGTIDSLPLPLPPTLGEQREIVAILDAINRKIDLHRRKRAVLEELFKALLHKLMTGEVAIRDLDLTALKEN